MAHGRRMRSYGIGLVSGMQGCRANMLKAIDDQKVFAALGTLAGGA